MKSFNSEKKSSKNEQMCKKNTAIAGTKESILEIIALPPKE